MRKEQQSSGSKLTFLTIVVLSIAVTTQSTTRKVEEAYAKLTLENLHDFQNSEAAKKAVKLLGEAINYRLLTKNEFVSVRDYLLVTTLCENASRPGPLQTAKVERFTRQSIQKRHKSGPFLWASIRPPVTRVPLNW